MAKRRTSTRKTKKSPNSFVIFLFVIIILALLSFGISYFVLDKKNTIQSEAVATELPDQKVQPVSDQTTKEDLMEMTHLQGTWVSNYDGTMLTIQSGSCTFESPAVDSSDKMKGSIQVNKSIVTFVFAGKSTCGSSEGHYEYQLEGDGEIFFKKIKDPCQMRSELMSASWFRL